MSVTVIFLKVTFKSQNTHTPSNMPESKYMGCKTYIIVDITVAIQTFRLSG